MPQTLAVGREVRGFQPGILEIGQEKGLINWSHGAVDGSFSPWEGRW
ncbi:hypothetical protein RintRC_6320 [Richelia intracellularis]|nr:hypothetical protein RintRC_6320 [Richelia intracellularis]